MNESVIEKAAEAIAAAADRYGTKHMSVDLAYYLARAAYPHLRVWEEPTEEEMTPLIPKPTEAEISRAADRYEVMFRAGVPWLSIVNRLLDEFVSGRNVLPVTVDPRERVILGVLYEAGFPEGSRTTLTKRILAKLDEAKGK